MMFQLSHDEALAGGSVSQRTSMVGAGKPAFLGEIIGVAQLNRHLAVLSLLCLLDCFPIE